MVHQACFQDNRLNLLYYNNKISFLSLTQNFPPALSSSASPTSRPGVLWTQKPTQRERFELTLRGPLLSVPVILPLEAVCFLRRVSWQKFHLRSPLWVCSDSVGR
jgi:hypothetical protein